MKHLNKSILLIFALSLLFYNCSSDDDLNGDPIPQTENLRLSNYSRGFDEYTVSYNDNGKIVNYNNDSSNLGTIIYNADDKVIQCAEYNYTYNAQGRISSITEPDGFTATNKETTILYNNDGLIVRQTLRFIRMATGNLTHVIRDFEYNGTNQLVSVTEQETGLTSKTRELLSYSSNGNVIQVKRQMSSDGINYTDDVITNYTYDTNINPNKELLNNIEGDSNFSSIYLGYMETMSFGNYVYFRLIHYSNNNIISSQRISSSGTSNRTYDYVYNDEGQPISAEIYGELSDGTTYSSYRTWTYETY